MTAVNGIRFGVSVLSLGLFVSLVFSVAAQGRMLSWEVADSYKGWVIINWGQSECPPLKEGLIFQVGTIDSTGIACTKNPMLLGWFYSRFEYIDASGQRRGLSQGLRREDKEVWFITLDTATQREVVFIGTEDEMRRAGPAPCLVCPERSPDAAGPSGNRIGSG